MATWLPGHKRYRCVAHPFVHPVVTVEFEEVSLGERHRYRLDLDTLNGSGYRFCWSVGVYVRDAHMWRVVLRSWQRLCAVAPHHVYHCVVDLLADRVQRLCWMCLDENCLWPDRWVLECHDRRIDLLEPVGNPLADSFRLIRADLIDEPDSLSGDVKSLRRDQVKHRQRLQRFLIPGD
jgi:hypothetical protein